MTRASTSDLAARLLSMTRHLLALLSASPAKRERAGDGTPKFTHAESRVAHPRTRLTKTRYDREQFFHWPMCALCGRFIEEMYEHLEKHEAGLLDARGQRTDAAGRRATARRLASRGLQRRCE